MAMAAAAAAAVPKVGVMGGAFPVTNDDFMARLARRGGNAGDTARVMMLADLEMPRCSVYPDECYVSMATLAEGLIAEGCTHVAFPCCTAHQWFERLAKEYPALEPVDMLARTKAECDAEPLGLLATSLTVEMDLWGDKSELVLPCEATQKRVQQAVEAVGTGKSGLLEDGTKAEDVLAEAAREVEAAGAKAIILGCTDIGTYCPRDATEIPLVDAMDSLVNAIADVVG